MNIIPFIIKLLILHNLTEPFELYYEEYDVINTIKDKTTFYIRDTDKKTNYENFNYVLDRLSEERIRQITSNNCYLSNQPHLLTTICDDILTKFEMTCDVKTQFPVSPYQYGDNYMEYFSLNYRTKYYPVLLGEAENNLISLSYMSDTKNMYEDVIFVYYGLEWIGWISVNEKM